MGNAELALNQPSELDTPLPAIDTSGLSIIRAPNLGSVLPVEFYRGAGELFLNDEQILKIRESMDCPDDEIDVRPEEPGLIYVRHMWYERKLTDVFGPGGWSMVPATDVQLEAKAEKIYVMWVLRCRGADGRTCYIGQAMGSARLQPDNPRFNKADAFEITRSDAVVKICAKTLGIGSNLWHKRFARAWRNQNCVRVKVKTFKGTEEMWRRKDEDRFDNEIQDNGPSRALPQAHAENPPRNYPEAAEATPATPAALPSQPAMVAPAVSTQQVRMFIARCRAKKLIINDDAHEALKFVCEAFPSRTPALGKTSMENLIAIVNARTQRELQNLFTALGSYKAEVGNEKSE